MSASPRLSSVSSTARSLIPAAKPPGVVARTDERSSGATERSLTILRSHWLSAAFFVWYSHICQ